MQLPQSSQMHLWFTRLDEALYKEKSMLLLSADEIKRAERYKFSLHRKRFISARAALRSILSLYLKIEPQKIQLLENIHGKLYLEQTPLEFNLSHSHDLAIYAFTHDIIVGIDLEKVRPEYNNNIAQRFFSTEEYAQFSQLAPDLQVAEFYKIWTGKEALVKALGKKLSSSLSSSTIPTGPHRGPKTVFVKTTPPTNWYLENLDFFPGYQASVVTHKIITHFSFWEWTAEGEKKWRDEREASLPPQKT